MSLSMKIRAELCDKFAAADLTLDDAANFLELTEAERIAVLGRLKSRSVYTVCVSDRGVSFLTQDKESESRWRIETPGGWRLHGDNKLYHHVYGVYTAGFALAAAQANREGFRLLFPDEARQVEVIGPSRLSGPGAGREDEGEGEGEGEDDDYEDLRRHGVTYYEDN